MTAPVSPRLLDDLGDTPEQAAARLAQEVDAFEAAARAREADWLTRPRPGAWSPAQLTEHVLLANASFGKVVHLLGSGRPLPEGPRVPSTITNGKVAAPSFLLPGPGAPWAELELRWREAHARFLQAAGQPSNPARLFWHPSFGDLDALGWTRAAAWHTRHHRRQLS